MNAADTDGGGSTAAAGTLRTVSVQLFILFVWYVYPPVLSIALIMSAGCRSAAPETMPLLSQDALEYTLVTVRPPSGEVSGVAEFGLFDEQGTLLYSIEKLAARQLGR